MATLSFLKYLRGIYQINLSESSHKVQYAVIQSIYDCFVMAKDDLNTMRLEMCLSTATGYWLDCWGDYFSIYRQSGELDEHYSKRIIDSVIKPKSTIPAIKDSIVDHLNSEYGKEYTRQDITLREPWKDVSKYSHKGGLSHTSRFLSGDYYSHAVIDISVPEQITPELIDIANAVKAAGVKIVWSVLNSYDVVSGFNEAEDSYVLYDRHIQTRTERRQFTGLVLSNSSPSPMMSGKQVIWSDLNSHYCWYAVIRDKLTDESIIITKKDLIGLIDYYTEVDKVLVEIAEGSSLHLSQDGEVSSDGIISGAEQEYEYVDRLVRITDELVASLEVLDYMLTLSDSGKLSTIDGVMFHHLAEHELFDKMLTAIEEFKENNPEYYNSVQPPILNGERAMWLVERNNNWLWDTPTLSMDDFYEYFDPYDDYVEYKSLVVTDGSDNFVVVGDNSHWIHFSTGTKLEDFTLESIIDFEDAFYNGYITFGDKYQPPISVVTETITNS